MYKGHILAAVVPAYNEAKQIEGVADSMPDFIDHIVIINDASTDNSVEVMAELAQKNPRVVVLTHEKNKGAGGGVATGYKWCAENNVDIAVTMDGDGQMDPDDLPNLLRPIVDGEADFTKGNRLISGEAYKAMPKIRYFGNAGLSMLTKIASGYWHIADSQTGYTAINKDALRTIDWEQMYTRYGYPNDRLTRLNIYNFKVMDVEVRPIYNVGEVSTMKLRKAAFTIGWLVVKLFFRRMWQKYVVRDFHPLVFFYTMSALMLLLTLILFIRVIVVWAGTGHIPSINMLTMLFTFTNGMFFMFMAMWMDMENNRGLNPNRIERRRN